MLSISIANSRLAFHATVRYPGADHYLVQGCRLERIRRLICSMHLSRPGFQCPFCYPRLASETRKSRLGYQDLGNEPFLIEPLHIMFLRYPGIRQGTS